MFLTQYLKGCNVNLKSEKCRGFAHGSGWWKVMRDKDRGNQEFYFGYFKFEIPIRHLNVDTEQVIGYGSGDQTKFES